MPKPRRRAKETRARGLGAPPKKARAKPARTRKPARSKTPLIDRLIAAAEEVTSGRTKLVDLTDMTDEELRAALSGPVKRDDD